MNKLFFLLTFSCFLVLSCSDDSDPTLGQGINNNNNAASDWLIPENLVFDGGPGKDGIPSIDRPRFSKASEIDFLHDRDLILAIKIGDEIKAYPHPILDWHEIVNDDIGGEKIALTYCPLTGTGIGWSRIINDRETTFGVSGLLYNSNLMPYDRLTNSTYSQQRLDCVNGSEIGSKPELFSFAEVTWQNWRDAYPESLVLNTDTGINRDYGRYPYGNYRSSNSTLFPITNNDNRLPKKDRLLGVRVGDTFKAYPFDSKVGNQLIEDQIEGADVLVVRNTQRNFIVSFFPEPGLTYTAVSDDQFPVVIEDSNNVRYDILGTAIDLRSEGLEKPVQFIGYWFSWPTFYEDLEIYEG